jgi:EAL domain-containing protein (putative c-di-GMP-specific phosphodiesterase class I)
VTFECPESAVTSNAQGLDGLYALSKAGFQCTLDDFGAGYCSFALLQQLPLTALKIDITFIEEIDHNPQSRELVAALLAFGKRLGLRTIAEGVDSPAQLRFLRDNGCDAVQGFLFGQPLTAGELESYLKAESWRQQL